MVQTPGFVAWWKSTNCGDLYIYGLKQSPRASFDKFIHVMLKFGLKGRETGDSVFYCQTSPKKYVYLIVYVDDTVIIGNGVAKISQVEVHLFFTFKSKILIV